MPALAGLRGLPWTEAVPSQSDVLRGDGLAALPVRHFTGRVKIVFHGTRVQDGVRVPVTRVLYDGPGSEEHGRGHPERG